MVLRSRYAAVLFLILLAGAIPCVASETWTAHAVDDSLSRPANWSCGAVPTWCGTATLEFGSGGTTAFNDVVGSSAVAGLVFNRDGHFYFDGGSGSLLVVGSGGVVSNPPNNAAWKYGLGGAIQLGAPQTWRQMGGQSTLSIQNSVDTNGKTLTLQADRGEIDVPGSLAGSGSLIVQGRGQQGAGTVMFAGANSYTGPTTIQSAGVLGLNYMTDNSSKVSAAAPLAIRQNAMLLLFGNPAAGTTQAVGPLVVGEGSSRLVYFSSGQPLALAAAGLQREAHGTLTIDSPYSDFGVSGGGLSFANAPVLSGSGAATSRGIVPYAYYQHFNDDDPAQVVNRVDLLTVDGQLLRKLEPSEQTNTLQSGANVRLDASAALSGNMSVHSLVFAGSNIAPMSLNGPLGSRLTVQSGVIACGGVSSDQGFTNYTIAVPQLTFGPNNATGYEGIVGGIQYLNIESDVVDNDAHSVDLTVNGSVYLKGHNTYSGATRVVWGALVAAGSDSLPHGAAVTVEEGAALSLFDDQSGLSHAATIGSLDGNGWVNLGSGTLTVGANGSSPGPFTGTIFGDGVLKKTGSGTLVLAGTDSFTGGTILDDGTLILAGVHALDNGTSMTLDAGGRLVFDPAAATVAPAPATNAPAASMPQVVPEPSTLLLFAVALLASPIVFRWGVRGREHECLSPEDCKTRS